MRAAARYRPTGRGPYYFARGKLSGDPVFAALLRDGLIKDAARIVDVGCGLGVLAAWLAAAEVSDPTQRFRMAANMGGAAERLDTARIRPASQSGRGRKGRALRSR